MNLDFDKESLLKLINYYRVSCDKEPLCGDCKCDEHLEELYTMGLIDLREIMYTSHSQKYLDIQITKKGYDTINMITNLINIKDSGLKGD